MIWLQFVHMVLLVVLATIGHQHSVWAHQYPLPRSEIAVKTLMDIPQTHCLRLFKHDVHLMRRCRNHRVPMQRRPINRK